MTAVDLSEVVEAWQVWDARPSAPDTVERLELALRRATPHPGRFRRVVEEQRRVGHTIAEAVTLAAAATRHLRAVP